MSDLNAAICTIEAALDAGAPIEVYARLRTALRMCEPPMVPKAQLDRAVELLVNCGCPYQNQLENEDCDVLAGVTCEDPRGSGKSEKCWRKLIEEVAPCHEEMT